MIFAKFISYLKEKGWLSYVIGFLVGCILTFIVVPSINFNNTTRSEIEKSVKSEYDQKLAEQQSSFQQQISSKESEISSVKTESSQKEESYKTQIASLSSEISNLHQSNETEEVEIHHADGSWEKRKVSKSTVDQLNEKIAEVKQQSDQESKQALATQQASYEKQVADIKQTLSQQMASSQETISSKDEEIKKLKESTTSVVVNEKKFGLGVGYTTDQLYQVHVDYTVWGPVYIGGDVETNKTDKSRAAASVGIRF